MVRKQRFYRTGLRETRAKQRKAELCITSNGSNAIDAEQALTYG